MLEGWSVGKNWVKNWDMKNLKDLILKIISYVYLKFAKRL